MRIMKNPKSLIRGAGSALLLALALPSTAAAGNTQACVEGLWPAAKGAGVTRATFDRAFAGFTPDPEVVEAANFQPEYVKPIGEYIDRAVSDKRVETGKLKLAENQALLGSLETRYGVDRHIIVAIWGVESNYGVQPGDKNVIRSLGTLICTGTKAKFARSQLVSALKILQRGDINFEAMNGSWAGAMGHTQFIPTTYSAYAVDQDGDGKRDIWGNVPDALASTASYLKVSNWRAGETWGYEVSLPKGFDPKRVNEKTLKPLGDWQKLGIVRADGTPVYGTHSNETDYRPNLIAPSLFGFCARLSNIQLLPGKYTIRAHALDPEGLRLFDTVETSVRITGQTRDYCLCRLEHEWLPGAERFMNENQNK